MGSTDPVIECVELDSEEVTAFDTEGVTVTVLMVTMGLHSRQQPYQLFRA